MRDMIAKGRDSHRAHAKLSEEDIVAIRNDSRSSRRIAIDYGVWGTTIDAIRRRKTWKDVA
jgi:hypothetical protein